MNLEAIRAMVAEWRRFREAASACVLSVAKESATLLRSDGAAFAHLFHGSPDIEPNGKRQARADAEFLAYAANAPVADVLEQLVAEIDRLRRFQPRYCPDDVPCPSVDDLE